MRYGDEAFFRQYDLLGVSVVAYDTLPDCQRGNVDSDGDDLCHFFVSEHPRKLSSAHTSRSKSGVELRIGAEEPRGLCACTDGSQPGPHVNVFGPQFGERVLFVTDVTRTVQHQDSTHVGPLDRNRDPLTVQRLVCHVDGCGPTKQGDHFGCLQPGIT